MEAKKEIKSLTIPEWESLMYDTVEKSGVHQLCCSIRNLSGEQMEGIFLAIFGDDGRQVFEFDGETITLMFTKEQLKDWNDMPEEDQQLTLDVIALAYLELVFRNPEEDDLIHYDFENLQPKEDDLIH